MSNLHYLHINRYYLVLLSGLLFYFDGLSQGATSKPTMRLQGQLIEQYQGSVKSINDVEIVFQGFADVKADAMGNFQIDLPAVKDDDKSKCLLDIQLAIKGYKIISPFNGVLTVDQSISDVQATVVAMKEDENKNQHYQKQIYVLNQKLKKLQTNNKLSNNRINAINDSLLLSINLFTEQRAKMDREINQLNDELGQATDANEELRYSLEKKIEGLKSEQQKNQDLRDQLYEALEEKYLRQQKYYKAISADLKDYLIRAKDVLEQVQKVKEYFPQSNNPGYVETYNATLKNYNTILVKINEQHKDYVENVEHYWSSPRAAEQVAETFNVVFEQLHYPKLQPALGQINGFIRVNKRKKAEQFGQETFKELYPIILNLEKSIDKTLTELNLYL